MFLFLHLLLFLFLNDAKGAELTQPLQVTPNTTTNITFFNATIGTIRVTVVNTFQSTTRGFTVVNGATLTSPSWLGPTLYVRRGGTLRVLLTNALNPESAASSSASINQPRFPNITNFITSGGLVVNTLGAAPLSAAIAPAGGTREYVISIPSYHMAGTHYYASHVHGSSADQRMGGGVVGALIIQDDDVTNPLSNFVELVVVLQHVKFNSDLTVQHCSSDRTITYDLLKTYSLTELDSECRSDLSRDSLFADSTQQEFVLTNGVMTPTLTLAPQEARRVRLVAILSSDPIHVTLAFTGTGASVCSITVIATDGVYVQGTGRVVTFVRVVPGQRMDLIVTCNTAGSYNLNATWNSGLIGTSNEKKMTQIILVFTITGTAVQAKTVPLLNFDRPVQYLVDQTLINTPNRSYDIHTSQTGRSRSLTDACVFWLGQGSNCASAVASSTCTFQSFQGFGLTSSSLFTARVGEYVQFQIISQLSTTSRNVVTLYVRMGAPFQITSYVPATGIGTTTTQLSDWSIQIGDWRDTIPALDGVLTIRFYIPATSFGGEGVVHGNNVFSDKGMMTTFAILAAAPGTTINGVTTTTSSSSSSDTTISSTTYMIFVPIVIVAVLCGAGGVCLYTQMPSSQRALSPQRQSRGEYHARGGNDSYYVPLDPVPPPFLPPVRPHVHPYDVYSGESWYKDRAYLYR